MKKAHYIPMETLLKQLDLWYRTPLGNCLLETEYAALAPYFQDCFGEHLLQLGGPGEFFLFRQNPTFHSVRLSPEHTCVFRGPSVRGLFEELPFLPESLHAVLLPHVLEWAADPQAILTQSQLVLVPEGRLIILGFNTFSLCGLFKYMMRPKAFPWRGRFISAFRMRRWLMQLDFVIEETQSLFFRPPMLGSSRWLILEALGRLLWADYGAVYLIVARKRVVPLIPVGPALNYSYQNAESPSPCGPIAVLPPN
jgi:SAM-dependent methyltransferase